MFYSKDFECIRQVEEGKTIVDDLKENPPTTEEIKLVVETRKADCMYGTQELLKGERDIRQDAKTIKEALLKKDGLVAADKQDQFREQIEQAFSDDNLNSISTEIDSLESASTYDKQSSSISRMFSGLFSSQQDSESILNDTDGPKIDRNYILALQKAKPDHAKYYSTLKKRLNRIFFLKKVEAKDIYAELKKVA